MTQIHIDESGFTGADYCNLDQPLYVLACSWFDPEFATSIERPLLDKFRHNELKFSKLVKSVKGKKALIGTIDTIANSQASKQYAVSVVHKPSALVRKFALDCIEPFFHEAGIDMLKDGRTLGYANLMSCVLPSFMSEDWFLTFLKLYNNLIRSKNESDNIALYEHCLKTEQHSDANEILRPYLMSPHLVMDELSNATYRADIYEQIVFGLVVHIRNNFGIKNFEMILDSTKATTSQDLIVDLQRLETLTKTHKMSDFCTVNDDIIINSVVMMDSKEKVGIRMSDLIAGLYSWTFKSVENRKSDVGQALINKLPEDNLIHMIASDQVTPADLGMEGTSNPFV